MSDIEIAQRANKKPIAELVGKKFGIPKDSLEPYGHYKAKVSLDYISELQKQKEGKLILVTALSPTPAGEGKTTTSVGLADALNRIGKKTIVCLREPSLGPCFGVKGGAAGGGYAQVVPMEDINLHFTGDFHAIGAAHNLLAAMLDNHIQQGNVLNIDPRKIVWRRVVDMNDRALRNTVIGMGGPAHGIPRESGFDITVASEVMAIFCLSTSIDDLKKRLGEIVVGYGYDKQPIFSKDLKAEGAMAALLKDAIKPNLVQTLENNVAFIHGGPFANIAHGCNSVIATQTALRLADYVVTEAGFGADLGAEKFIDIKCRMTGIKPQIAVLVATIRAIKFHGGVKKEDLNHENLQAVRNGLANLERHIKNIQNHYKLPCVVAINHFIHDTEAEIDLVRKHVTELGSKVVIARHWAEGGKGAEDLANTIIATVDAQEIKQQHQYLYSDDEPLWDKITAVCKKIYGAKEVTASPKVKTQLASLQESHPDFPICIAKTQMSFSTDPTLRGAPTGHNIEINELRLANGARFIVVIAGDMMTMPGLPKVPAAENINVDNNGNISGLF